MAKREAVDIDADGEWSLLFAWSDQGMGRFGRTTGHHREAPLGVSEGFDVDGELVLLLA